MKIYQTKINKIAFNNKEIEHKFYIIYESLFHSIISDFFTFSCITLAFLVNHFYIGSRMFSVILFMAFFVSMKKCWDVKTYELKPKEFIENIIKELEVENEVK